MGEGEEIRSFVVGVVGLSALELHTAKVDFEDVVGDCGVVGARLLFWD